MDGALLGSGRTVIVQSGSGLIGAGDHGGAAGRADRAGDVAAGEADALGGERINVGRLALVDRVPVASNPRRHVLDEDPEDVQPALGMAGPTSEQEQQAEYWSESVH